MNDLQVKILITIVIVIFFIFIYTLFFFNWSNDFEFWSKQKNIHAILNQFKNKSKSITSSKLNKAYSEIENLFKDKQGEIHTIKMYTTLSKMIIKNDKGDKYLINALLMKMKKEQKYFAVSKNFQILFRNIDDQLSATTLDKNQLKTNITLVYNKIGDIEREANFSKKGYWVGLFSLIITILSIMYSITNQ